MNGCQYYVNERDLNKQTDGENWRETRENAELRVVNGRMEEKTG